MAKYKQITYQNKKMNQDITFFWVFNLMGELQELQGQYINYFPASAFCKVFGGLFLP